MIGTSFGATFRPIAKEIHMRLRILLLSGEILLQYVQVSVILVFRFTDLPLIARRLLDMLYAFGVVEDVEVRLAVLEVIG